MVAAGVIVQGRRLLVVSKRAAPDVFYLPGGKPDPGETPEAALTRELGEELGVRPVAPRLLMRVEARAALEGVPLRLTVFTTDIDGVPRPAAELAHLRWITGTGDGLRLSPALGEHILPRLRADGLLD
ncbi:hypothetical protein GCM10010389_23900 [Streptomyces echinoruber]|uniref:8-oxo-dGTP diphosphatase n=1 Tax=Streptomyces echinoruber TaxID=68898 RepID=A0A918R709_9ACTN|nr:hypothetical protein GCM10010389_23900 [Streptomyces echinoruber]